MRSPNETLVFIPTYNEKDNVPLLYQEIKQLPCAVDILFLDDNSPDGTGKVIDELVKKDPTIFAIHRSGKLGLGTAHLEAYKFAQKNNYSYLITMDADFTHHPKYIPVLLNKKEQSDIVIGSRYAQGGTMKGWGTVRLPFTYFWRSMIKRGLKLPYDCTGAFRLYRVSKLKSDVYQHFSSRGFSFCMESLYHWNKHGLTIGEVPIEAHSRIHGDSKLSTAIMAEVARMYFRLLYDRLTS